MMDNPMDEHFPDPEEFLEFADHLILDRRLKADVHVALTLLQGKLGVTVMDVNLTFSNHTETEIVEMHYCGDSNCDRKSFAVMTKNMSMEEMDS